MTVAVQMPQGGDDIFSDIMKGLNIAGVIGGIKSNRAEVERLAAERQKKIAQEQREQDISVQKMKGNYTPGEVQALQIQHDKVLLREPEQGAVQIGIYNPDDISAPAQTAWLKDKPKAKEVKPNMNTEEKRREVFANLNKIQSDIDKDPEIRAARETMTAFERIKQSTKQNTAAGDMSFVYAYVKMLDPGSVVKEGEYNVAENARGYSDSVLNLIDRANTGKRLTPDQRKEFYQSSVGLAEGAMERANAVSEGFKAAAEYGDVPWKLIRTVAPPKGIDDIEKLFPSGSKALDAVAADTELSAAEAAEYARKKLEMMTPQQSGVANQGPKPGVSLPMPAFGRGR